MIFHDGLDLPLFAAFHLLRDEAGRKALRRYYARYAVLAREQGLGFVLEPTWRASPDWAARLGYTDAGLARANRAAVALMGELRAAFEGDHADAGRQRLRRAARRRLQPALDHERRRGGGLPRDADPDSPEPRPTW